ASWTIVMVLTGLVLWWPRGGRLAGVVYPRLTAGGRRFWRDLHGVTGFWVSAMTLLLLVSGLPWAKSWGTYLKTVRTAVEGGPVKQDWTIGAA
ncbi:PepSY domain-containing protein, partial [Streptococcus suis]